MPKRICLTLSPEQASDPVKYLPLAAKEAGTQESRIALARVIKKSIDARRGPVKVNLTLELFIDDEPQPDPVRFDYADVSNGREVIIIGCGPAGLFSALRLIELGYKPIILERGKEVAERKKDIAKINRNGEIDPDSNYAFGEGGAGTFSDGKLYTRSKKRGNYNKALQVLNYHGANESILYDAHPHIGTDRLPRVITNMRNTITSCGGKIFFGKRITRIIIRNGIVKGVECSGEKIDAAAVIIAAGHSARDIYRMLHREGITLETKPFAMGVRIEHPQALIDSIQYRMRERGSFLPAASYSLVSQIGGRGVYSFCMCPGGFIVPASTSSDESVVNGMSPSGRTSPYANSGIVTEIKTEDFAELIPEYGVLAGLEFQERLEKAAKLNGGTGQVAPAQRVADFVQGKNSRSLPSTSYVPGTVASNFSTWLPGFMDVSLKNGIKNFGAKMKGFVTNEALILGVESRTSTPVRIPRDPYSLQHPQISGLFPCGEGAGYAGGIISAALDGEKTAEAVHRLLDN